jgi:hypothetical protein
MIRITLHQKYVIKSPISGNPDYDQMIADYRDNLLTWGCPSRKVGDVIEMDLLNGVELDIMDFVFIMSKDSGNVEYFNPVIRIPVDMLDNQIPEGLSNRLYFNGDVETIHTWRTWRSSAEAYPIVEIDGYAYFMSSTFGNTLSGTELMLIYMSEADLVLTMPTTTQTI